MALQCAKNRSIMVIQQRVLFSSTTFHCAMNGNGNDSIDTGNERKKQPFNYRSRSHLTEMLWKDRYARGTPGPSSSESSASYPSKQAASVGSSSSPSKPTEDLFKHPKRMNNSFCEVILPFRTDLDLREDYVNHFRGLRFGKVLEDLDALAGSIAFKHCFNSTLLSSHSDSPYPIKIVTASVDRIDLLHFLRPDLDLKLSGNVTYTGRSSMEVTIRVESLGNPDMTTPIDTSGIPLPKELAKWTPVCLCKFTMVARDAETNTAVPVNPLLVETEMEKKIFELGEQRKLQRMEMMKQDLRKIPPSPEERILVHELWLEAEKYRYPQPKANNTVQISYPDETIQKLVRIMHPQERNVHSSIFGGYLMREAFELGYSTAMLYLKGRPFTVALEDIAFTKPVPIGSILFLTSEVVYAQGDPHRTFQVKVTAEVSLDYRYETRQLTNTFYITFARALTEEDGVTSLSVNRLLPKSYTEAMEWLMGQRRRDRGIRDKELQLEEFGQYRMESDGEEED